jgi:hypothetical protein
MYLFPTQGQWKPLLSASISPDNDGYSVKQIHISQGKTSASMTIDWVTSSSSATQVKYGLSPDQLNLSVSGSSSNYTIINPPYASYSSGDLHTAQLTSLQPETTYYYQCGDFTTGE